MIKLNRLNGQEIIINADMIKYIEATPDTLLTLMTGEKLMVQESVEEVIERVIQFRRQVQYPQLVPWEFEDG